MSDEVTPDAQPSDEGAPAPRLAFERWAVEKYRVVFDDRGRASGVANGKRIQGATRAASTINAARRLGRIPLGKTMTEAEFQKAIRAAESIVIK